MKSHILVCLLGSLLFATAHTTPATGAETLDKTAFDKNGDGKFDAGEAGIYFLHVKDPIYRKYDINRNGKLDADELSKYASDLDSDAQKTIKDGEDMVVSNSAANGTAAGALVSGELLDQFVGASIPEPGLERSWFRLRGKVADFGQVANSADSLGKLSPATLSYSRDYASNGDTWSAKGAVGGFWETNSMDFSLGAEFERVQTNLATAKDVNSLIFKALGSGELSGLDSSKWLSALTYRLGVDYGTNFDFDGGILGGSIDIEPTWDTNAFKRVAALLPGQHIEDSLTLGLRNYLHVEGGGTMDSFPGKSPSSNQYLRVGPVLEATIWPFGIKKPLSLTASYGYWAELLGDGPDYHNFRAGADWRLDEEGHYSLRVEYVNGLTPLLVQEQESLLLSLSVRF